MLCDTPVTNGIHLTTSLNGDFGIKYYQCNPRRLIISSAPLFEFDIGTTKIVLCKLIPVCVHVQSQRLKPKRNEIFNIKNDSIIDSNIVIIMSNALPNKFLSILCIISYN